MTELLTSSMQLCATGCLAGAGSVGYVFGHSVDLESLEIQVPFQGHDLPQTLADHRLRIPARRSAPYLVSGNGSRPRTAPAFQRDRSPQSFTHYRRKSWQKLNYTADDQPLKESVVLAESRPTSSRRKTDSITYIPRRQPSSLLRRFSNLSFASASNPLSGELANSRRTSAAVTNSQHPERYQRPRNKLVKRSLSQSAPRQPGEASLTRRHTLLERPSTTHERLAATSSERRAVHDAGSSNLDQPIATEKSEYLSSYFSGSRPRRVNSLAHFTRTVTTSMDTPGNKGIAASPSKIPVLCRPDSIAPTKRQERTNSTLNNGTMKSAGNPNSRSHVSHTPASDIPLQQTRPTTKQQNSVEQQSPRRRFSASSLTRSNGTEGQSRSQISHRSSRITSAPSTVVSQHGQTRNTHVPARQSVSAPRDEEFAMSGDVDDLRNNFLEDNLGAEFATSPSYNRREKLTEKPLVLDTPPSTISATTLSRHSAAFSDLASSHPESESDGKVFSSADEDDGRSDTAYDSMRTWATKNSSANHSPALDTLFDEEPRSGPQQNHESVATPLRSNKGLFYPSPNTTRGPIISEEESSSSTPGRTTIEADRQEVDLVSDQERDIGLSPSPLATKALSLGKLAWDSDAEDGGMAWSEHSDDPDWVRPSKMFTPVEADKENQDVDALESVKRKLDFNVSSNMHAEADPRSSLFDWSESNVYDRNIDSRPPPRPKTVHGKKRLEPSGALSVPRRAPSGLHMRSQSVPVLVDLVSTRSDINSRFGTWGVGSKTVTEDWNEDFEFDDSPSTTKFPSASDPRRNSSDKRPGMIVPDIIKVQQTNVLANISLLKEWGMLIEELKSLRNRASVLDIPVDEYADTFDEVDAMIDLADQEVNDEALSAHHTPTSSPGFLLDDSEQNQQSPFEATQNLRNDVAYTPNARANPKQTSTSNQTTPTSDIPRPRNRSRKDSEAIAQSVIEILQNRRHPPLPSTPNQSATKKIPFDTRTLRKIVPHVNGLVRRVKHIIREAEALHLSPPPSVQSSNANLQQAVFNDDSD